MENSLESDSAQGKGRSEREILEYLDRKMRIDDRIEEKILMASIVSELELYESNISAARFHWFSLRNDSIHWESSYANARYQNIFSDSVERAQNLIYNVVPRIMEPYSRVRTEKLEVARDLVSQLYFNMKDFETIDYKNITVEEYNKHPSVNRMLATFSSYYALLSDNYVGGRLMKDIMVREDFRIGDLKIHEKNEFNRIDSYDEYLREANDDRQKWRPASRVAFYYANKRDDILSEVVETGNVKVLYGGHEFKRVKYAVNKITEKLDERDRIIEEELADKESNLRIYLKERPDMDVYPRISSYYLIKDFNSYQEMDYNLSV